MPISVNFNNNSAKNSLSYSSFGQKSVEKVEEKKEEKKLEKKMKEDSGYSYNYCIGRTHLARDCMLRKKEEKNGKVKDETYYAITIEELRAMSKNLFLVAKDSNDDDGTYQIWSSGFDDEYIRHPTHGVMYEKHVVDDSSDKSMFGEFVEESKDKAKK